MEGWQNFFLGELGASAALAGLIFVSLSVNQERVLASPSLPERGLEALMALFLVLIVSSLMLVPNQGPRLVGTEVLAVAVVQIVVLFMVQRIEYTRVEAPYRHNMVSLAIATQAAAWLFGLGALLLILRADWLGLYVMVPGTLLCFICGGINAWVLLIEINR
jgi:modulator of FtsH protease